MKSKAHCLDKLTGPLRVNQVLMQKLVKLKKSVCTVPSYAVSTFTSHLLYFRSLYVAKTRQSQLCRAACRLCLCQNSKQERAARKTTIHMCYTKAGSQTRDTKGSLVSFTRGRTCLRLRCHERDPSLTRLYSRQIMLPGIHTTRFHMSQAHSSHKAGPGDFRSKKCLDSGDQQPDRTSGELHNNLSHLDLSASKIVARVAICRCIASMTAMQPCMDPCRKIHHNNHSFHFIFHFLFHLILHYSSFHFLFHYPNRKASCGHLWTAKTKPNSSNA